MRKEVIIQEIENCENYMVFPNPIVRILRKNYGIE